jgi:outer membrane protein
MLRQVTAVIFVVVLMAGEAIAAPAAKVGVVDLKRAVAECKEGVAARAELLKKSEQFNAELKVMQADFEKTRAELEKETASLSADARTDKELQLQKKLRAYQNRQREDQEELKQVEASQLNKLVNRLGAIMGKIGNDGNFGVILDRNTGVLYTGKEIDITTLLIQRADAEFGKLRAVNEK